MNRKQVFESSGVLDFFSVLDSSLTGKDPADFLASNLSFLAYKKLKKLKL